MVDGTVNQLDNGQVFISGIASGINTGALIEAAYQQKLGPAILIDEKIAANSDKVSAFNTLRTLADDVRASLENLVVNTSSIDDNVFDSKAGFLSATSVDPTTIVSASIDTTAAAGSYTIEVISRAQEMRTMSDATFTPNVALGDTGSFTIGLAGGATSTINVTAGMSLNDLASAINTETGTTNVSATVMETTPGEFRLILSGTENALAIEANYVAGDDVLQNIGITSDGAGTLKNVVQNEQAAQISFDGVPVTRTTNTFNDIVPGIDLEIINESPGTIINLEVDNDVASIKTEILNFVDAYNAYREFALTHQELDDSGNVPEDAVLFSNNTLRQLNDEMSSVINTIFDGATGAIETLRDVGITFTPNNSLSLNESTLDDALLNDFENVRNFFEAGVTSSDPANFRLLSNDSIGNSLSFTIDITVDGMGDITSAGVGGDTTLFTVNGNIITGAAGTIYEGLSFAYIGGVNTSINVDFTQGFADLFSNRVNEYSDIVGGIIQDEVLSLTNKNAEMGAESTRIIERAEDFRQKEIERYARMETAVQQAEFLQEFIRAILLGQEGDS